MWCCMSTNPSSIFIEPLAGKIQRQKAVRHGPYELQELIDRQSEVGTRSIHPFATLGKYDDDADVHGHDLRSAFRRAGDSLLGRPSDRIGAISEPSQFSASNGAI